MNRKLKAKIVENFGCQSNFAETLGCHEARVSQIVNERRKLKPEEQKFWSRMLNTKLEEIFVRSS